MHTLCLVYVNCEHRVCNKYLKFDGSADARQHAIYLAAQMVTHVCGPVEVERAPPLTPSQVAARDLVDRQDREYEEARLQDLQRSPPEAEATPASVSDPVGDEPSAREMRRARLRRFGLPSH